MEMTELPSGSAVTGFHYDGPRISGLLPSLLLNAAVPVVLYQILTGRGFGVMAALSAAALFPVLGTIVGWARSRQLDAIAVVSLVFIAAGMATSLISGDPRFLLLKESMLTAAFGLACFGSLLLPRPLIFYFARQFYSRGDRQVAARFDSRWEYPRFRYVIRLMTIVWGSGYLAEALLRVLLQSILPIPAYLVVSQLLVVVVTVSLIAWTLSYARRATARAHRM